MNGGSSLIVDVGGSGGSRSIGSYSDRIGGW